MATSKSIGNGFERRVSKIFAKNLGGKWIRTPTSGGYVGGKNSTRIKTMDEKQVRLISSDIIPPKEYASFYIECKKRKEINFTAIAAGNCKEFDKWIRQVYESGKQKTSIPMLIFSEKGGKVFICMQFHTGLIDHLFGDQSTAIHYYMNNGDGKRQAFMIYYCYLIEQHQPTSTGELRFNETPFIITQLTTHIFNFLKFYEIHQNIKETEIGDKK
jgi:hypothetical protein